MAVTNHQRGDALLGPNINAKFLSALENLVAIGKMGHRVDSDFFNPSDEWLKSNMRIFQDLPEADRNRLLDEAEQINLESNELNEQGRAGIRVWPDVAVRLDSGGLGFFSQLGVARRPDLTQYFVDGFQPNRDAIAFSEANQELFAEIIPYISKMMEKCFSESHTIVQTDRQIGDVPSRSFQARQLLFGTDFLQLPYMWRQLTFDIPEQSLKQSPDILEISVPKWLDVLGLPDYLKMKIQEAGLTRLVFKAPTKGLSLHLGFDYMGEHKMGPLSVAMFLVKQEGGLALQAALSMARIKTLSGDINNVAMVTTGPSLHGKSTLTVMIELADSRLSQLLHLDRDTEEGVYPMNDDIILIRELPDSVWIQEHGKNLEISYGIYGTENNLYAVPFGLTREGDPVTYDVLRGTEGEANKQETLENVPYDASIGAPNFMSNPVRNMRMILSRSRLLQRKRVQHLPATFTENRLSDMVHVPMESIDKVLWQGVMRQNTVIPPLIRLTDAGYVRALMYGEAVQTGAATGAIGRPYVEYFSDPFIIGLEDENANLMFSILAELDRGGLWQEYYMFNTGGLGADTNEEASGRLYKKIDKELTMMLQEAVLRNAVKFEADLLLGVDVAVAIVDSSGQEILDLRAGWLPSEIYGHDEYEQRVLALKRKRFYGVTSEDKSGILRYTRANNLIIDINEIPAPINERELTWLLSFCWNVDKAYDTINDLISHSGEGWMPSADQVALIGELYSLGLSQGLELSVETRKQLALLGIRSDYS